ncbi:sporulation and spore germination protein [Modestobacter roseus]|uniref:Sporulation and spore germination protein n=2 Tax=Modestobacter roseus TaxID=1181884 RepID=A0A562IQW3_9ACTN|nr:sporulation and spore germination protein [Modestobacter roseus]
MRLRVLGVALAAALLTGCGVSAQDTAEPLRTGVPLVTQPGAGGPATGQRLTVYLVRGARLTEVERRMDAPTVAAALDQVVDGPTRAEAADGVRTALAPEVVGVEVVLPDGTTTVAVTRGFTSITGGNQLLAVAQVVWTLTGLPTVTRVRFTVEGMPVELPTDTGLSTGPVGRGDYLSVAPAERTPSGTAPSGTAPSQTAPSQTGPSQTAPSQTGPSETAPADPED